MDTATKATLTAGTVFEIPISQIQVPAARKRRIDKQDEKTQVFLDSVKREGILHPILVRKQGEGFELISGRLRLWAAQQLEMARIPASIRQATDDQMNLVAGYENYCRGHLSAAQQAKEYQNVLRNMELVWGPDPGQSVGGKVRAELAERSRDGKLRKSSEAFDSIQDPAIPAAGIAGDESNEEECNKPKTHAKRIIENTGVQKSAVYANIKLAKTLTSEQLDALHLRDATQDQMTVLANFKDAKVRNAAVLNFCGGLELGPAISRAEKEHVPTLVAKAPVASVEGEITDQEFLTVVCGPLREKLQDPTAFDLDALFYRRDIDNRAEHRRSAKDELFAAKAKNYSPLVNRTLQVLFIEHPRDWYLCAGCIGKNVDNPKCDSCYGVGYSIRRSRLPDLRK